ncbi:MAG: siroheme synthase CysG [Actinomycetota bacterium]|nr:siroheme synthase CysG [Actinomycetota bacterium]
MAGNPRHEASSRHAANPRYFVGWDLAGRRVLVVGGGEVAQGKIETLLPTGARIRVVAPVLTPRLADLAERGEITWHARRFRPRHARGCALVVAAEAEPRSDRKVRRAGHRHGALVNVVDVPELCDVIVPATIHRGPATIAITTSGATPAAARFLREQINEVLPVGTGELLEEAADARRELRHAGAYRYDYRAWRERLLEPGLEAVRSGRTGAVRELRRRFVAEFASPTPLREGRVTIVGAGPGGADLITVRGARAIASADVILYDRLADPELLTLAPVGVERIPVGKAKGHGVDQDEIARLLVERARRGDHVVRLKGGDPFVFGRGGEELDAVTAAGFACEVVPGLSSSMAGAALAGIPVTHRGEAASVLVLSGHRAHADDDYDWAAVAAGADTIVVLMAATTAGAVGRRLLDAGRPAEEPVAVVHRAGTETQESTVSTLAELAERGSPYPSPSILVIGRVAARARSCAPTAREAAIVP